MPKPSWRSVLEPYIEDKLPNGQGEQGLHCPIPHHDDKTRSASINFEKMLWYCNVCQAGGTVGALVSSLRPGTAAPVPMATNGAAPLTRTHSVGVEKVTASPVNDEQVVEWHCALLNNTTLMNALYEKRGLLENTLSDAMVGWSRESGAFTIPIPDIAGEWQNVRFYDLTPSDERRKIWSMAGHGSPILYPFTQLDGQVIGIVEGEWDTLLAIQHGFAAVTRTGAADVWRSNWNRFFTGKDVWICHDMDEKGQHANAIVVEQLKGIANTIRIVTLPYPVTEKHGKDLTDFFWEDNNGSWEFQQLIEASPLVYGDDPLPEKEDDGFLDLGVLETFDAKNYKERIRLRATVVGKEYPTFLVPKVTKFNCKMDLGPKCVVCPLSASEGKAMVEIAEEDPVILRMLGSSEVKVAEILYEMAGIPGKCPKVKAVTETLHSVEKIFVRPDIDTHRLSHEAGDYTARTVIAVGHHDTLTNQTVETKGSIWPDPKDQHNQYLASELTPTTTSIDSFTMTEEKFEYLRAFHTKDDPLVKAIEIARDLERHVTGIRGRTEMHVLMDLAFHSILAYSLHGAILQRGWLDVLVVGDTRTGKSEAATALLWHYGAGELVSGESTSFAGIVGGLEQMGGREWSIKWGAIPMNDRRLVVIDEVSGLSTEQISNMSSIRSSGEAVITKIHTERTLARTRLIWLGNPREARMSDFTYGIHAIKPLIGNPEDIARFDLAMSVRSGEVSLDVINDEPNTSGGPVFTSTMCRDLLLWCWSRRAEHVFWADGVEEKLREEAKKLGREYIDDPPLIQGENVRVKIARVAVALAARTFNSPDGEVLLVEMRHLRGAVRFINTLYGMRSFGYRALSSARLQDSNRSEGLRDAAKTYLESKPDLQEFLATHGKFKRQDMEDMLNYGQEEARATINQLWGMHMIRQDHGFVMAQPVLNEILREGK